MFISSRTPGREAVDGQAYHHSERGTLGLSQLAAEAPGESSKRDAEPQGLGHAHPSHRLNAAQALCDQESPAWVPRPWWIRWASRLNLHHTEWGEALDALLHALYVGCIRILGSSMAKAASSIFGASFRGSWAPSFSLVVAAGLAAFVAAPRAAEAASATWTFEYLNNLTASITVEAAESTLVPGTPYSVTAISGSIGAATITGLTPFASSTFWYNPDSAQFPIETDNNGIYFSSSDGLDWNIYFSPTNAFFGVADLWYNTDLPPGNAGAIAVPGPIASVAPRVPPSVPSPLPIFGVSGAFSMSRRLRRRMKAAD